MKWCHSATLAEMLKSERANWSSVTPDGMWFVEGEVVVVHDAVPNTGLLYDDDDPAIAPVKKLIAERRAREEAYRREQLSRLAR